MYVVVRLLLGDEMATFGHEVEVFGLYATIEVAKLKREALCEANKAEDELDQSDFEDGIHIVKLRTIP